MTVSRLILATATAIAAAGPHTSLAEKKIDLSGVSSLSQNELFPGGGAILINAGTAKSTAYIRYGMQPTGMDSWKWDVALETPYDTDKDPAILGDFDGVSSSTNLSANFSNIRIIHANFPDPLFEAQLEICEKYAGMSEDTCDKKDVQDYVLQMKDPDKICERKSEDTCKILAANWLALFNTEMRSAEAELISAGTIEPVKAWIYGFKGRIGHQEYDFINTESLEGETSTESPWSFSLYGNYMNGDTVYGGGFEIQESFRERDEATICERSNDNLLKIICDTDRFGEPREERRELAYLQVNRYLPNKKMALMPRITHDFESGETGMNLSLFFMRNEENALTGGVLIGWQSDTDEVTASVFIGKPFSRF